jgi:hypothetical protein
MMSFTGLAFAAKHQHKPNYDATKKHHYVVKQHPRKQAKQSEKAQNHSKEAIKAKPPKAG